MTKIEFGWVAFILIVIIGATSVNLSLSKLRSRDAQRKDDLNGLSAAVQEFHDRFAYYPQSQDGKIVACGDPAYRLGRYYFDVCEWPFNSTPLYGYSTARLPLDPKHTEGLSYRYESDGASYQLLASLEDQNDTDVKQEIVDLGLMCGNRICNFVVASQP